MGSGEPRSGRAGGHQWSCPRARRGGTGWNRSRRGRSRPGRRSPAPRAPRGATARHRREAPALASPRQVPTAPRIPPAVPWRAARVARAGRDRALRVCRSRLLGVLGGLLFALGGSEPVGFAVFGLGVLGLRLPRLGQGIVPLAVLRFVDQLLLALLEAFGLAASALGDRSFPLVDGLVAVAADRSGLGAGGGFFPRDHILVARNLLVTALALVFAHGLPPGSTPISATRARRAKTAQRIGVAARAGTLSSRIQKSRPITGTDTL